MVYKRHLPVLSQIPSIAAKFPNLKMVIDHLGKPQDFAIWKQEITEIAKYPNVYVKLSGQSYVGLVNLVKPWSSDLYQPYIDHSIAVFGSKR